MSLTVPPPHIAGIKTLLDLPDDRLNALLAALDAAGPQFNIADLATSAAKTSGIPRGVVRSVLEAVASLYWTLDPGHPSADLGSILDVRVRPALVRAELLSESDAAQWIKLSRFLQSALSLERTIGTTVKAGPVLTEHERIFQDVRVMTDLRPIYHIDASERPNAALVIHMLKITQRNNLGVHSDLYFALDSNDITKLKEALERAQDKETTLRKMMEEVGVRVLTPKESY